MDLTKKILKESNLTPADFIIETEELVSKVLQQLNELGSTVRLLEKKSNSGIWYFSGQMQNEYGIKKDEAKRELFDNLKTNTYGNLLWSLEEAEKYAGWCKKHVDNLKKSS